MRRAAIAAAAATLAMGLIASAWRPPQVQATGPFPAQFVALAPERILDTRGDVGGHPGRVGGPEAFPVQVGGRGGVPLSGASAVVLNVTVSSPSTASYLTVFPAGQDVPTASNLNFSPGQTVANMVTVTLSPAGTIGFYNRNGSVDVLADVEGYYASPITGTAGLFRPLPPTRIMDSRTGNGGTTWPLGQSPYVLQVAGRGGVPGAGVSAVVVNLTATGGGAGSFLAAYPGPEGPPGTSNLNFGPGQTIANRVVVRLGPGGTIRIFNAVAWVHVIVDIGGWFTDGSDGTASGGAFTGVAPSRILDTRGGPGPLGPSGGIDVQVTGRAGVPGSGVGSAVLNVTATNAGAGSLLTAYPTGIWLPLASDLNFGPGQTVPNQVMAKLGQGGRLTILNAVGFTDVVVDVAGYYSDAPSQGEPPGPPAPPSVSVVARSTVAVSWSPPPNQGSGALVSYTVIMNPGWVQTPVEAGTTSLTIGGLHCGGGYSFMVAAANVGGGGGPASGPTGVNLSDCPSTVVIGDVPWYHQTHALSCEAASLQMLLAHQHIGVNQDQILAATGIDYRSAYYDGSGLRWGNAYNTFVGNPDGSETDLSGYGVYYPALSHAAQSFGGQVLVAGEGIAPGTLYQYLLEGHPAVAWVTWDWGFHSRHDYLSFDGQWIPYAGPLEHAVAIIGVSPDSVLVNDPDRTPYWLPKSTFEASYATYNRMALVLV